MKLNKKQKEAIFKAVDRSSSFNIFGYANLSRVRGEANIPDEISDKAIQSHLNKILEQW